MIKIGYIGNGTASTVSLLANIHNFLPTKFKDADGVDDIFFECIHDPNTPIFTVGESISGLFPMLLKTLGYDINNNTDFSKYGELFNEIDMTIRYGNKGSWEDNLGKEFTIDYRNNIELKKGSAPAAHVNAEKVSKYLLKKIKELYGHVFKEHHDKVISITQKNNKVFVTGKDKVYEYDYVFDCRGTPSKEELDSDAYKKPEIETVNSAIIFPDFKEYNESYTTNIFHRNGWLFGIPLRHRKAFGYLYNRNITTKDEAIKHFPQIVPHVDVDTSKLRSIEWNCYYKKQLMDNRIISLGNRLFFFEPAMGLPLHYYINVTTQFGTYINNHFFSRQDIPNYMNLYHNIQIEKIQDLVALNYVGRNEMTSEFWKQTSEKARTRLKNSSRFQEWLSFTQNQLLSTRYYCMDWDIMAQYIYGYNIDLKSLIK